MKKRGPDSFEISTFEVPDTRYVLYFAASVLSLRGNQKIVKQPISDGEHIFLWNGEIWSSDLIEFDGKSENDGLALFKKLQQAQTEDRVLQLFSSIKGPFSFVFYTFS